MALLASRLLHRHLLCLLRRLLVLLPPQPSTSLPVFLLRTARDSRAPSPAAPLRAALRRKKQGSQKDARRRGALWLINTRRLVRGRTVTHVHGVGRSLSLSFPFSVSVPLCRPSPHPAAFAAHPSLSFIYLSLSSSLNHVPFFFSPSLPPSLRAVTLVFPGSPCLRLSFSRPPRPFSLVISSSFALSIFLLLLSPSPPIFPLPYACLLSFFRSSTTTDSSLLTPSSRAVLSSSLSSLSTYPRRLRRDGPIFSSRFLGSDIFYTFFLPPPPFRRLPMRRPPPPSEYRLEHPLHLPPSRVAHTHMVSLPLVPSILRPFPLLIRPPLASLSPLFHFSLPLTPRLCLSLLPLFHPPCSSYFFDFFFTATRPPTDAARRRPFSIGTLFSTIGSTTYSRTHVRSQPAREGETER